MAEHLKTGPKPSFVVSTSNVARANESTTRQRNRYIIGHADRVVLGALTPGGNLASLIAPLPPDKITLL